MKILVTGGSGFVGMELIRVLMQNGYDIINVDIVSSGIKTEEHIYDLTKGVIDLDFDFCFHLASACGGILFNQNLDIISYNDSINRNVSLMCKKKPVLFVSTLNVFEGCNSICDKISPQTTYAQSKLSGEHYFKNWYVVRPCNLFGKSQIDKFSSYGESHVIPDILHKINNAENELEVMGDGSQKRSFLHVKDFCNYLLTFLHNKEKGKHNVASFLVSIKDLVEELVKLSGKNLIIKYNSIYMKYEKMFIEKIINEVEDISIIKSISLGLKC